MHTTRLKSLVLCGALAAGIAACTTTYATDSTVDSTVNSTPPAKSDSSSVVPNTQCSGVDVQYDTNNCGICGKKCAIPNDAKGALCDVGKCLPDCNKGFHRTIGSYACEADVTTGCGDIVSSNDNCGSCGVPCTKPSNAKSATCTDRKCVPTCDSGFERNGDLCRRIPDAASDAAAPQSDAAVECGGANYTNDPLNCGGCGNACGNEFPRAQTSCNNSNCQLISCNNNNDEVVGGQCTPKCATGTIRAKDGPDPARCVDPSSVDTCGGYTTSCPSKTENGASRYCQNYNLGQYRCSYYCNPGFFVPIIYAGCVACGSKTDSDGYGNNCSNQRR